MLREAEIGHRRRAMLQFRKAEERRGVGAQRELDRAVAFFDFVLGELLGHLLGVQVGMRPGVGADRVSGRRPPAKQLFLRHGNSHMVCSKNPSRVSARVGDIVEVSPGYARNYLASSRPGRATHARQRQKG